MLRGAIWDLDGTILDSMSAWDHVGENYLRSQGIEPKPDLDEAIATMSLHQAADYFIEHYGVKQTRDELIKSAVAIVDDFYRYEAQLKPHLKEFLAQLHETGVKMCIATATERSLVEAALARCGVLDYFSEIFTCSSVGAGKDEPTIYREALNFLGTDRTNTMVFEDSLHALTTAKKDGFYTTAVYDSHEENQEEIYSSLESKSSKIEQAMKKAGLNVNRTGSIMTVFFTDARVTDYDTAQTSDTRAYARYFKYLQSNGIYTAPSQFEAMFVSYAHSDEDIEKTCKIISSFKK